MKRLCIYFFYDEQGFVDQYVLHMLSAMRPHCDELVVVSNGRLQQICKKDLQNTADTVVERENIGFDVWAYKFVLEKYGWQALSVFDEIILMNHTIMGPVFSFDEVFSQMDELDVDFWGLTTYHQLSYDPMGKCKFGYIPLHLQSHFIAWRKKLIESDALHEYWAQMPLIQSYEESVCFHEAIFTKTFSDLGFSWKSYVDTSDLEENNECPIIYTPVEIIREKRCPVFKRRSFFHDYDDLIAHSLGNQAQVLMEYLQSEKLYNTDFIWDNILRTCNLADVQKSMNLNYILSVNYCLQEVFPQKIALILHLYYEECFAYCYQYALSMPKEAHVYITTSSQEKKISLLEIFSKGPWSYIEVRVIENRGRDISSLLVGCHDVVSKYELVCFAHDKKSHQGEMGIIGESFSEHCFGNVLGSKQYVKNIIGMFQKQPRLGLLCPPPPYHAGYTSIIGQAWTNNYENVVALASKLDIKVPINKYLDPIAPLGTTFWFRPPALNILFQKGWNYKDFPEEPNDLDGTLLHAIERIYSFVAQQAGYYSAWVATDSYASRYTITLCHMLRKERFQYQHGAIGTLLRLRFKRAIKRRIPTLWWRLAQQFYLKLGGGKWMG